MFYYIIFDWGNLYHIARVEANNEAEAIEALELPDEILHAYRMELYSDNEIPEYVFTEMKESRIMLPRKLVRLVRRAYCQDRIQALCTRKAEYEKELEKWK